MGRSLTIRYLEEIGSPAELPAEMNSLKSQQFRWMKGGAETAKKMLPTVWKSSLTRKKKVHATIHLLSSTIFIFVFIVGVFSVPLLFALGPLGINADYFTFFLLGLLSIAAVYYVANVQASWQEESRLYTFFKFFDNHIVAMYGWREDEQTVFQRINIILIKMHRFIITSVFFFYLLSKSGRLIFRII